MSNFLRFVLGFVVAFSHFCLQPTSSCTGLDPYSDRCSCEIYDCARVSTPRDSDPDEDLQNPGILKNFKIMNILLKCLETLENTKPVIALTVFSIFTKF